MAAVITGNRCHHRKPLSSPEREAALHRKTDRRRGVAFGWSASAAVHWIGHCASFTTQACCLYIHNKEMPRCTERQSQSDRTVAAAVGTDVAGNFSSFTTGTSSLYIHNRDFARILRFLMIATTAETLGA